MRSSAGWTPTTLGAHVDLLTGFPFKSAEYTDDSVGIPLLRGANVSQGRLDWSGVKRWPSERMSEFKPFLLQCGDVILAMDRPWIEAGLKYAWITSRDLPCLLVQRVARMRGTNGLLTAYLRYLIGSKAFTDYIAPIVTGVNVPHISPTQIKGFRFNLPPVQVQSRIVSVLSAYDDLIENNRLRIELLEQMAQTVYQEWFVKFRSPGHENVALLDSELGPIPKGWEVRQLGEVCARLQAGGTPSRKEPSYWEAGTVNWFTTTELQDGFLLNSGEKITEVALNKSSARMFDEGTILMAIYGSPTVGRLGILTKPSSCNQAALGLVADERFLSQPLLYQQLIQLRGYFNAIAQGAAQQNISKAKVAETRVYLPPRATVKSFNDVIQPLWKMRRLLTESQSNLLATHDLLLPRLISGEIDVLTLDLGSVVESI
jgi:type I restriction enzyme, S subunit